GAPFTAERLRAIVEVALLERGCASDGAICAPGAQAADPHKIGEGPLHAGEPIVMDIFPQHKATRYWADMTRTVSKGEPPKEIRRMYDVVRRAQDAGIEALRPGIIGRAVHELVEDIIWEAGYDTLRPGQKKDPANPTPHGFIHSTGHGVGLEIHEAPGIGRVGAAVVWGFADYAAALSARRVGAVRTAFGMQATGLVSFAIALFAFGGWPALEPDEVPYALALGVLGVVSITALYRALALGPVAVVAPVVASYVAVTVLLVVVFLGERLTGPQLAAATLTFVGVVLTSTDGRRLRATLGRPVPGVRIGLIATVGFGLWGAVFAVATRAY